jgi:hypothetical protein
MNSSCCEQWVWPTFFERLDAIALPGLAACQVFHPGARFEVLSFLEAIRGALGGQLYPWQLWSSSFQDKTNDAPV